MRSSPEDSSSAAKEAASAEAVNARQGITGRLSHIARGFRAQELDQPATAGFFAKVGLTASSPRETHCCILGFHRSPGPQIFRVQPTVTNSRSCCVKFRNEVPLIELLKKQWATKALLTMRTFTVDVLVLMQACSAYVAELMPTLAGNLASAQDSSMDCHAVTVMNERGAASAGLTC